jgi:hypothetical protein
MVRIADINPDSLVSVSAGDLASAPGVVSSADLMQAQPAAAAPAADVGVSLRDLGAGRPLDIDQTLAIEGRRHVTNANSWDSVQLPPERLNALQPDQGLFIRHFGRLPDAFESYNVSAPLGVDGAPLSLQEKQTLLQQLQHINGVYENENTLRAMEQGGGYGPRNLGGDAAGQVIQNVATDEARHEGQAETAGSQFMGGLHAVRDKVIYDPARDLLGLESKGEQAARRASDRALSEAQASEYPITAGVAHGVGQVLSPESLAAMAITGGAAAGVAPVTAAARLATAAGEGAVYGGSVMPAQRAAEGGEVTPGTVLRDATIGSAGAVAGNLAGRAIGAATERAVPAVQAAAKFAGGAATSGAVNTAASAGTAAVEGRDYNAGDAVRDFITGAALHVPGGVPDAIETMRAARDRIRAVDPRNSVLPKLDNEIARHATEEAGNVPADSRDTAQAGDVANGVGERPAVSVPAEGPAPQPPHDGSVAAGVPAVVGDEGTPAGRQPGDVGALNYSAADIRAEIQKHNGRSDEAIAAIAGKLRDAQAAGEQIIMRTDGRDRPVIERNGMLEDQEGKRWGMLAIAMAKDAGDGVRTERPQPPATPVRATTAINQIPWVRERMIQEGKNPDRLLNEIDAAQGQKQLRADPLHNWLDRTNPQEAHRFLRGDFSAKEYSDALKRMQNETPPPAVSGPIAGEPPKNGPVKTPQIAAETPPPAVSGPIAGEPPKNGPPAVPAATGLHGGERVIVGGPAGDMGEFTYIDPASERGRKLLDNPNAFDTGERADIAGGKSVIVASDDGRLMLPDASSVRRARAPVVDSSAAAAHTDLQETTHVEASPASEANVAGTTDAGRGSDSGGVARGSGGSGGERAAPAGGDVSDVQRSGQAARRKSAVDAIRQAVRLYRGITLHDAGDDGAGGGLHLNMPDGKVIPWKLVDKVKHASLASFLKSIRAANGGPVLEHQGRSIPLPADVAAWEAMAPASRRAIRERFEVHGLYDGKADAITTAYGASPDRSAEEIFHAQARRLREASPKLYNRMIKRYASEDLAFREFIKDTQARRGDQPSAKVQRTQYFRRIRMGLAHEPFEAGAKTEASRQREDAEAKLLSAAQGDGLLLSDAEFQSFVDDAGGLDPDALDGYQKTDPKTGRAYPIRDRQGRLVITPDQLTKEGKLLFSFVNEEGHSNATEGMGYAKAAQYGDRVAREVLMSKQEKLQEAARYYRDHPEAHPDLKAAADLVLGEVRPPEEDIPFGTERRDEEDQGFALRGQETQRAMEFRPPAMPEGAEKFSLEHDDVRRAAEFSDSGQPSAAFAYGVKRALEGGGLSAVKGMTAAEAAESQRGMRAVRPSTSEMRAAGGGDLQRMSVAPRNVEDAAAFTENPSAAYARGVKAALLGRAVDVGGLSESEAGEARRGFSAAQDGMTDAQRDRALAIRRWEQPAGEDKSYSRIAKKFARTESGVMFGTEKKPEGGDETKVAPNVVRSAAVLAASKLLQSTDHELFDAPPQASELPLRVSAKDLKAALDQVGRDWALDAAALEKYRGPVEKEVRRLLSVARRAGSFDAALATLKESPAAFNTVKQQIRASTQSADPDKIIISAKDAIRQAMRLREQGRSEGLREAVKLRQQFIQEASKYLAPAERGPLMKDLAAIGNEADLYARLQKVYAAFDRAQKRRAADDVRDLIRGADVKHLRPEFKAAMEALTGNLDNAKPSERTRARAESLANYMMTLGEDDRAALPPRSHALLERLAREPLDSFTVDELHDLGDSIRAIVTQNQLKNKLIVGKHLRDLEKAERQTVQEVARARRPLGLVGDEGQRKELGDKSAVGKLVEYTDSPEVMAVSAGGEGGELHNHLYDSLRKAENAQIAMQRKYRGQIQELLAKHKMTAAEIIAWRNQTRTVPLTDLPQRAAAGAGFAAVDEAARGDVAEMGDVFGGREESRKDAAAAAAGESIEQGAGAQATETARAVRSVGETNEAGGGTNPPITETKGGNPGTKPPARETAKGRSIELTGPEALSAWLYDQNPDAREKVLSNPVNLERFAGQSEQNRTLQGEDLARITATLTPFERDLGKLILEQNQEVGQAIGDVHLQLRGFDIAREENYFPLLTDQKQKRRVLDELATKYADRWLEQSGFLKERVKHKVPVLLSDALDTHLWHLRQATSFANKAVPVRNARMLLGAPKVREVIDGRVGKTWTPRMEKLLKDFSGSELGARTEAEQLAAKLARNAAAATLGLRPTTVASNFIGAALGLLTQTTPEESRAFVRKFINLKSNTVDAEKYFNSEIAPHNPYLADRYDPKGDMHRVAVVAGQESGPVPAAGAA